MYDNLKSLGITNPEEIDRYSLRQEANNDILKIYFQKDKGEFFAKSVKFKYPRQRKTVVADGVGQGYKEVQEISPNLRYIIDELDQICQRDRSEVDQLAMLHCSSNCKNIFLAKDSGLPTSSTRRKLKNRTSAISVTTAPATTLNQTSKVAPAACAISTLCNGWPAVILAQHRWMKW